MTDTHKIISTGEAAKMLGVGTATVCRWYDIGKLKGYEHLGTRRTIKIRLSSVEAVLRSGVERE